MIISLPIEIKDREYLPKLLLSHYLMKRLKVNIILSRSRLGLYKIQNYKNAIFFDKSLSIHKEKLSKNIIKNNILSVLDEEGPITNWIDFMIEGRLPLNVLENTHLYFVRGMKEKIFLKEKFKKNFKNVKVVGHPKYDLLKSPFKSFFDNDVEKIKKDYGKYVFIPLSFIQDLKGKKDKDYSSYLFETFAKNNFIKQKYKESAKKWDHDEKNYNYFLQTISELANLNKNINFVIRPHPTQDISKIKNRMKIIPNNLHIVYKYSINPWIIGAHYYIHSHCTSVYEAAKLRKKIFCYNFNKKNKGVILAQNPGYIFDNKKKFLSFFQKVIKKKVKYDMKKIILDNSFLFNFKNNKISCEEIVKHFSKLSKSFSKDKFDLDQNYFDRFKIEIKKILFQIIKLKNYFLNKESYFSSKYFDINVTEINLIIKKFRKIDRSKYKISVKEIDNNIILISNF